jgi:hypothetical protein
MEIRSTNFLKNFFLERLLDTRLYFIKEKGDETNFIEAIRNIKNILIILPLDRSDEINSRKYIKEMQSSLGKVKISTLDIATLRKNDTNWLGVPNQHYLSKIQDGNFDLLIDLNGYHDRICAYMGALTAAPLRVHASRGKFDKIYNLEIRTSGHSTLDERYKSILNYLVRLHGQKN